MDDDSKHTLIAKGSVVAKQQKISMTNLKSMNVALEQNLKEAPQVDLDAINTMKQKRLAKAITFEDRGHNSFGIAKKIQKIMLEQEKKKKKETISERGGGRRRDYCKGAQDKEERWTDK